MGAWELIWSGRSAEVAHLPDIDYRQWEGATQTDVRHYLRAERKLRPSKFGSAFMNVCAIMMVKDEDDIIGRNIVNLYNLGFRRFVVLDNGSSDRTPEILRTCRSKLPDCDMLILDDVSLQYTQSEKTTGLMRLANSYWPDVKWVFPIDADEFLCAEDGLLPLETLEPNTDCIVIQKVNHILTNATSELDLGHALNRMPLRQDLGRQPPKVALRSSCDFVIAQGNHSIGSLTGRPILHAPGLALGLYYREFQFRSFSQFKRKVSNGGRALLEMERVKGDSFQRGGGHWIHWYNILKQDGEQALLEAFCQMRQDAAVDTVFDPITTGSTIHL